MQIQHVCAFLCEAPSYSYQFAKFDSNAEQENNKLSYLAIVSCGLSSTGRTSFGVCGNSLYTVENLNSSNNYNIIDSTSFGTCFSTNDIKYHRTSFVNFLNSKGYDVMNTNFIDFPKKGNGTFTDGNVYNCTTKCIFQFRGINFINNFRFGKLIYDTSFIVGATAKFGHTLTFSNSKIDIMPTKIDTNVKINGGCSLEDPIVTLNIVHEGTEKCQLPTVIFTESEKFTMSLPFLPTSIFSPSKNFLNLSLFQPQQNSPLLSHFHLLLNLVHLILLLLQMRSLHLTLSCLLQNSPHRSFFRLPLNFQSRNLFHLLMISPHRIHFHLYLTSCQDHFTSPHHLLFLHQLPSGMRLILSPSPAHSRPPSRSGQMRRSTRTDSTTTSAQTCSAEAKRRRQLLQKSVQRPDSPSSSSLLLLF